MMGGGRNIFMIVINETERDALVRLLATVARKGNSSPWWKELTTPLARLTTELPRMKR